MSAPSRRAADETMVRRALEVAAGTPAEDVPVGAVVLGPAGRGLAAATNRREADAAPFAPAEVLARLVERADVLVELPADVTALAAGTEVEALPL